MERLGVLEVLDQHADVAERVAVPSGGLRIGRAWSCDLILDDRYVSPVHALVRRREDGVVVIEDQASTNGLRTAETPAALGTIELGPDTRVCVGQTWIRFRHADQAVEPAVVDPVRHVRGHARRVVARVVVALGVLIGLSIGSSLLASYERAPLNQVLLATLWLLVLLVLWTGAWSLAGGIGSRSSRFTEHLTAAAEASALLMLSTPLFGTVAFALSLDRSAAVLSNLLVGGIVTWLVFRHLRLCSTRPTVALAGAAAMVVSGVTGLLLFSGSVLQAKSTDLPHLPAELRPEALRLAPAQDLDSFLRAAERLKQQADAAAREH